MYFSLYCVASQASKDAARYPVAAKVAQLLIRGLVSFFLSRIFGRLNWNALYCVLHFSYSLDIVLTLL